MHRRSLLTFLVAALALTGACSDDDAASPTPSTSERSATTSSLPTTTVPVPTDEQRFPDVVAADVELAADGTARFDVTVSSPYDTPERYADAWRILGPDGAEYGVRVLTHDHAGEQPFTRSLDGLTVPEDVAVVTVEARDSTYGWGGATVDVEL
jgi:hypothetical protein